MRLVFAFLFTPSSKAFYSISMYARHNSLPIFGVSWFAFCYFFRDKDLEVPSITLLLDLFSVKKALEGFLYISKRATARPIIPDLPSSTSIGKTAISLSGVNIGNTILPTRTISWGFLQYGMPLRTCVGFLSLLVRVNFLRVMFCF